MRKRQLTFFCISYRRCTPVVVSSVTPRMLASLLEYQPGLVLRRFRIAANRACSSSFAGLAITDGSASARLPRIISNVASPPSSRIMLGALSSSGHSKMR